MVKTGKGVAITMWGLIITGFVVLYSAGCSSIPFQSVSYVSVKSVHPEEVRERFSLLVPRKFQLVSTIVFQYDRHYISAIGYIAIDTHQKIFTVVCLNPVGVKLFELSGDADDVECRFALEEFTHHKDFAQAVADDIKRIYFDRIPDSEAEVCKQKYKIVFRQSAGSGTMEYVFAGPDEVLIEKRYYEGDRQLWSVFYYEYRLENGKLYPAGIILRHHQYRYQLVVRLKEIRS